jgi:hypothetical protein
MGFMPPTRDLVKEALKIDPTSTIKEISQYVCDKQKRSYAVVTGSIVSKMKKELGITVREYAPDGEGSVNKKKALYFTFAKFPLDGDAIQVSEAIRKFVKLINDSKRAKFEVVELMSPHELEIREVQ